MRKLQRQARMVVLLYSRGLKPGERPSMCVIRGAYQRMWRNLKGGK